MEKTASKKKIFQVAKEINISHETLIAYLEQKGHKVKGIMTVVDDTMMNEIMDHFKKDREVAEKHHRKIQTIRETRERAKPKEKTAAAEPGKPKAKKSGKADGSQEVEIEAIVEIPVVPVAPVVIEQLPPEQPIEEAPVIEKEEEAPTEVASPEEAEISAKAPKKDKEVVPPVAALPAERKKPEPPTLMPRRTPKMGLTIKGKIDLEDVQKAADAAEGIGPNSTAALEAEK